MAITPLKWLNPGIVEAARDAGDAARDRGDWVTAEARYNEHLGGEPGDVDIWVQYGHSLKEQDKLEQAGVAYARALALRPEDADAHLQYGHLLKRLGRMQDAAAAYATSYRLAPTGAAKAELDGVNAVAPAAKAPPAVATETVVGATMYIEVDDLLGYLEAHQTLSGIQRVQVGMIQHVLAQGASSSEGRYVFVLNPLDTTVLWALRDEDLGELARYVTGPNVNHDRLRSIVGRARTNASATTPRKGESYLVLGAFWGYGSVASRYFHLKRAGVVIGVYVYDLIPITHPEYCDEGLSHEFTMTFGDAMSVFDFVLTISEFTAREVKRYRDAYNLPPMPIEAVPLAHATAVMPTSAAKVWSDKIALLEGRDFVLMVSTVEARKNHTYLVGAWKQFVDEGLDPPDLVFVGRVGWRVSSLMEMLKTTRYLDGRVHIIHDISDADLQTLYGTCLYTAFPSFVEGWGLPVGESLANGKPCVASSTSSVPEVGGDLVDYLDPHNLRDGMAVLRRMTFDDAYRARRTAEIEERFKLRDWQAVGVDVLSSMRRLREEITVHRLPEVYFPDGVVFRPGDLSLGHRLPDDYALKPLRLLLTNNWYGLEPIGCWLRGSRADLTFRTDLAAGTAVVVYVQMFGVSWATPDNRVSVQVARDRSARRRKQGGETVRSVAVKNGHFVVRARGEVDSNGHVTVLFNVEGHIRKESETDPNARSFVVGLSAIAYSAQTDALSRLEVIEELALFSR